MTDGLWPSSSSEIQKSNPTFEYCILRTVEIPPHHKFQGHCINLVSFDSHVYGQAIGGTRLYASYPINFMSVLFYSQIYDLQIRVSPTTTTGLQASS